MCQYVAHDRYGQVDPVKLARHLAAASTFARELTRVRIYRRLCFYGLVSVALAGTSRAKVLPLGNPVARS